MTLSIGDGLAGRLPARAPLAPACGVCEACVCACVPHVMSAVAVVAGIGHGGCGPATAAPTRGGTPAPMNVPRGRGGSDGGGRWGEMRLGIGAGGGLGGRGIAGPPEVTPVAAVELSCMGRTIAPSSRGSGCGDAELAMSGGAVVAPWLRRERLC